MSRQRSRAIVVDGDDESIDVELPLGSVSLRSKRDPEKTGPNEDAAAVYCVSDDAIVLAVADGLGGLPAGAEASTVAMHALRQSLADVTDRESLRESILDAMDSANRSLLDFRKGSATTLVVAEISGDQLRSYHVGDSELIVVGQRGRIKQRIVPHSPTGFAVEAGLLDEAEAMHHEERHILSNVIGEPGMRVEISASISIAMRDTVLLTTDGVLDNLLMEEIIEIIRMGPLVRAADRLIEAARVRMSADGGPEPSKPDDATIVLYRRGPNRR